MGGKALMPSDVIGWYAKSWTPGREDGYKWVESLLARFTYKPGWHIEQRRLPESADSVRLQIRFTAPDSRSLEREIPVTGTFDVPYYIWFEEDEGRFWKWLHQVILFMERHELDEWFRVDGKLVDDPHAGEGVFGA